MSTTATVDPAAANASIFAALPTSIRAVYSTNTAEAVSMIYSQLANPTGRPDWFLALPGPVQTYFVTANLLPVALKPTASGSSNSTYSMPPTTTSSSSIPHNTTWFYQATGWVYTPEQVAGTVLGVLGGLSVVSTLIFFYLRRRRNILKAMKVDPDHGKASDEDSIAELDAPPRVVRYSQGLPERLSQGSGLAPVAELPGARTSHELPENTRPASLEEPASPLSEMPTEYSTVISNAESITDTLPIYTPPAAGSWRPSPAETRLDSTVNPKHSATPRSSSPQGSDDIGQIEEELRRVRERRQRLQEMHRLREEELALASKLSKLQK